MDLLNVPFRKIRSLTSDGFAATVNRTESPNPTPHRTRTVIFCRQVVNWSLGVGVPKGVILHRKLRNQPESIAPKGLLFGQVSHSNYTEAYHLMSFDFRQYLVIGISSRALFDLEGENQIYETEGLEAYSKYQLDHEDEQLRPGVGFPLVAAMLQINNLVPDRRQAEVVIMSRNNADTSLRIFRSIESFKLDITRGAFTSGASLSSYLHAFDVDLFLSANESDVQAAIDAGVAAARVCEPPEGQVEAPTDQIRIAFDGDAVLFSEEADKIYQSEGLEAFIEHERANAMKPLPDGPFAKLLKTLAVVQSRFQPDKAPIRTALITARNSPSHERAIRTLRAWDVRIDEAFFLGGASKDEVLKAFRPHIFFDDQDVHLESAARLVPSAQVPYPSEGQLGLDGMAPSNPPTRKQTRRRIKKMEAI